MSLYDCGDLEAMLAAEEANQNGVDDLFDLSAHSSGDDSSSESEDVLTSPAQPQLADDVPFYDETALCPVTELHATAQYLLERYDACCSAHSAISGTARLRRRFAKEVELAAAAVAQESEEGTSSNKGQNYAKCNGLAFLELLVVCLENEKGVVAVGQAQPSGKTVVEVDVVSQFGHRWIKVKGADPRNVASEFNGTSDRNAFANTAESMVQGASQRLLPFSQFPQTVVLMYRVPTGATQVGSDLREIIHNTLVTEIGLGVVESYLSPSVYERILEAEGPEGAPQGQRFLLARGEVEKRLAVMREGWGSRDSLRMQRDALVADSPSDGPLPPASFTIKEPLLVNFDVTALVALCSDTCHGFAATTSLPQYPVLNRQLIDETNNPALAKYIYPALDQYTVPDAPRWWRANHGRWWAQDCKVRRAEGDEEGMGAQISDSPMESNAMPRVPDFHKGVITCSEVFRPPADTSRGKGKVEYSPSVFTYPVTHDQVHRHVMRSIARCIGSNGGTPPAEASLWSAAEREREMARDAAGIYIPSIREQELSEERDAVWCHAANPLNAPSSNARCGSMAGRYNWIVSDVAFAEFDWIVRTIASPAERQRARFLLSFIHIIPTKELVHVSLDYNPQIAAKGEPPTAASIFPEELATRKVNPCWSQSAPSPSIAPPLAAASRLCCLSVTGKIKPHHMAVFGLGDASQAVTVTANEQFLAAVREQQHTLAVVVHPSRALTGKKSLEAAGSTAVKYKPHHSDKTRLAVMGGVLASPTSPSTPTTHQ